MPEMDVALAETTIRTLQELLTDRSLKNGQHQGVHDLAGYEQLYTTLLEIRTAIIAFASGDLAYKITKKGFVPGSIKALQGALQHLTWQTKMIATGDFSQRVDFMGEFSESFNSMVRQLDESMHKLTVSNRQLEESQAHIRESIKCAKVIQSSILPRNELFDELFSDWFTLYRPCDIVGGDIYWLRKIKDMTLIAIIDCTGHGVPGAFMTMTVNSVLNQVVNTFCSDDPSKILGEMNRVLKETLHLRREGDSLVDAGLDIILCCIAPDKRTLTCAAAGLSLYLHRADIVTEIKGDRQGLGYSNTDLHYCYTNHSVDLASGTKCYATTDGFLDDNGGEKGFGFGRQRFKEMLQQNAHYTLKEQQNIFEETLLLWRGSRKQRDDITLVGFMI